MNDGAEYFATDSGPHCEHCRGTIWTYVLWPDLVSFAVAECVTCRAGVDIRWNTLIASPRTASDMRRHHHDEHDAGRAYPAITRSRP